jgi:hypothetical protein
MTRRLVWALAAAGLALVLAGCDSAGAGPSAEAGATAEPPTTTAASPSAEASLGPNPSPPSSIKPAASGAIDPASFSSTVDNAWYPLLPGTRFTYQGTKDGRKAVESFTVTRATKVVAGVTCVVVEDKVSLGGVPTERLLGYYAQDRAGNVWYFGEDIEELDANGQVVSTAGSWHAGINKATAAFFLEASPTVGKSFAHQYTHNDFAVLSLTEKVSVPYGSFSNALVTKEWSPLEPDIETHKYYVQGVGMVRDVAVKGPTEELVLVKVDHQ